MLWKAFATQIKLPHLAIGKAIYNKSSGFLILQLAYFGLVTWQPTYLCYKASMAGIYGCTVLCPIGFAFFKRKFEEYP